MASLIQQLLDTTGHESATLVGESFGGCLALRVARSAPHLVSELVLVNPATSFASSLGGISSLISATNLLGLFPQGWYNTAQAVLQPLLVDTDRVGRAGTAALRSMILMQPPANSDMVGGMSLLTVLALLSCGAAVPVCCQAAAHSSCVGHTGVVAAWLCAGQLGQQPCMPCYCVQIPC